MPKFYYTVNGTKNVFGIIQTNMSLKYLMAACTNFEEDNPWEERCLGWPHAKVSFWASWGGDQIFLGSSNYFYQEIPLSDKQKKENLWGVLGHASQGKDLQQKELESFQMSMRIYLCLPCVLARAMGYDQMHIQHWSGDQLDTNNGKPCWWNYSRPIDACLILIMASVKHCSGRFCKWRKTERKWKWKWNFTEQHLQEVLHLFLWVCWCCRTHRNWWKSEYVPSYLCKNVQLNSFILAATYPTETIIAMHPAINVYYTQVILNFTPTECNWNKKNWCKQCLEN